MRKLFLLATVLLLAWSVNGQRFISSWQDLPFDDSLEFVNVYGSVDEWNYQHSEELDKRSLFVASFIHAKVYYALSFNKYLAGAGMCGGQINLDDGEGWMTMSSQGCNLFTQEGNKVATITTTAYFDKNLRIKRAVITGPAQFLLRAFKGYWSVSDEDMLAVRKGMKFSKNRMDDLITFDWTGKNPKIVITKSPMITYYPLHFLK